MTHSRFTLVTNARPAVGRLVIDPPASGAWNMAVDEALLADAIENDIATLRFYQWSEPTLSLGYFQQYADRDDHPASRECACVRRQTGGGAILHDRELTYSLTLPASHPLARQSDRLYASVHEAFIREMTPSLAGGDTCYELVLYDQESNLPAQDEPFLCFQRRAQGDVVLLESGNVHPTGGDAMKPGQPADWKVLGSAQRRHRGAILQHGSLLLGTSPAAPELAGFGDKTGLQIAVADLAVHTSCRISVVLGLRSRAASLPENVELNARELTNTKYSSTAWTNRR